MPEIVQQLEEFHADAQEQRDKTLMYYHLNLDLQVARAQAVSCREHTEKQDAGVITDVRQMLTNWTVKEKWSQPEVVDDSELVHSVWGFQWTTALMEWVRTSEWPANPVEGDPGIAWSEIALCLVLQQGLWLPVQRKRGLVHAILHPCSQQDVVDLDVTFSEQTTVAYNLMNQLQGLTVQQVLPSHVKYGKCKSLYIQGNVSWTTGLSARPRFPMQARVFGIIQAYLASHSGLVALPEIDLPFDCDMWPEDMNKEHFEERTRIARLAMLRVRKRRNNA